MKNPILFIRQKNYERLVNEGRRRDNVAHNGLQTKEELCALAGVPTLLSTGRDPQLVGEVEFEAATTADTFSAVSVAADFGNFYTHTRWC